MRAKAFMPSPIFYNHVFFIGHLSLNLSETIADYKNKIIGKLISKYIGGGWVKMTLPKWKRNLFFYLLRLFFTLKIKSSMPINFILLSWICLCLNNFSPFNVISIFLKSSQFRMLEFIKELAKTKYFMKCSYQIEEYL